MPKYTLNDFTYSDNEVYDFFSQNIYDVNPEIKLLFNLNMNNTALFPNISLSKNSTWNQYILQWIKKYDDADKNPPSMKTGNPSKAPYDPMTNIIVKEILDLNDASINDIQQYHTLCMQAENIQGGLLEEYISLKVSGCGWIWCKGETVKSIDFCTSNTLHLLQIKNKYNTENSSSNKIREGTTIEKWYRLGKITKENLIYPDYKWDKLNSIIIHKGNGKNPHLSENEFRQFVINVISKNKDILYKL